MKKSTVLLAAIGIAALTGCQNDVMGKRKYIPLENENPASQSRQVNDFGSDAAIPAPAPAPVPAPAPAPAPAFVPMEGVKSSGGITSAGRRAKRASLPAGNRAATTYIVKSGDYPGKIARKFRISVDELLAANKMTMKDARNLRIGRKLNIPASAVSGKSGKRTAAKGGKAAAVQGGYYIVRSGDTPERIARRNKVKLADLLKVNNLTPESSTRLQIGQKLVIPGRGVKTPAPAPAPAPAPVQNKTADAAPVREKKAADPVKEASVLADSLEKTAPAAAESTNAAQPPAVASEILEITEDISLKDLAAKYNTTESHLLSLNEGFSGTVVTKGSFFFVPPKK